MGQVNANTKMELILSVFVLRGENMTFKHLQIFSEVCRVGSITKAAEHMNMAQPAVSNAIRELESYYSTKLFDRMNRRIYITQAGEQLYSYANSILGQFHETKDVIRDAGMMTKVRVGVNVSYGTGIFPSQVSGFSKAHPDIPLFFSVRNSGEIEEDLLRNELDFGIIDYPQKPLYFQYRLIMEEEMVTVCSPDFALSDDISIKDMEGVPLLMREHGSGSRNYVERFFSDNHIEPLIKMESVSTQSLTEMCKAGIGALFLPKSVVTPQLESGSLREIKIREKECGRKYYLVYHKSKYLTKSMQIFLEEAVSGR